MSKAASAEARIDLVKSDTIRYDRGTMAAPKVVQN